MESNLCRINIIQEILAHRFCRNITQTLIPLTFLYYSDLISVQWYPVRSRHLYRCSAKWEIRILLYFFLFFSDILINFLVCICRAYSNAIHILTSNELIKYNILFYHRIILVVIQIMYIKYFKNVMMHYYICQYKMINTILKMPPNTVSVGYNNNNIHLEQNNNLSELGNW